LIVARQRGIKKAKDSESIAKLIRAFIHKADESTLGRLLVELVILQSARTQADASMVLKEAAEHYRVDIDAIALKVKQEFAAKAETRIPKYSTPKRTNPRRSLPQRNTPNNWHGALNSGLRFLCFAYIPKVSPPAAPIRLYCCGKLAVKDYCTIRNLLHNLLHKIALLCPISP
jgi:hypothetical protein